MSLMEIKETRQKSINWEIFPKETVPALKAVLEELEVSSVDRDPSKSDHLRKNVREKLEDFSNPGPTTGRFPNQKTSNKEIAEYFDSSALDAKDINDMELASVYKSISYLAKAFQRSKTSRAK